MLLNFPALGLGCVPLRAIPNLACAEILRDFADALLDVIPAKANWEASGADASERHMNMRVFRIEVRNRQPFKRSTEILLYLGQKVASQLPEIGSVAKLRRDYYLPKAFIAGPLPILKSLNNLS